MTNKVYKVHLYNDQMDRASSFDVRCENFNIAYEELNKALTSRKDLEGFRLVGLYEVLYNIEKYNTLVKN